MVKRDYWIDQIEKAWKLRPIVWLSGVRRAGKTILCKSLDNVDYYSCDLPRVRSLLKDPEQFYLNTESDRIILDEVHSLENPSIALKIAADHFPDKRIIATGSSTLGAQKKFKDTLTGRKINIQLTPMLFHESKLFGNTNLEHRMLYGGLPPFFMSKELHEELYREWILSYFARDVSLLYKIDKQEVFIQFVELLLARSGGIFQTSRFAEECGVSRQTIQKYLHITQETYITKIVRPYGSKASQEIVLAPKVYGFDTGFICYAKGWEVLRSEYHGELWEHLVLNNIIGMFRNIRVRYWRDKSGHEIDFILLKNRNKNPIAVECKLSYQNLSTKNLKVFRRKYPTGKNIVVARDIVEPFDRVIDGMSISFVTIETLSHVL